MLAAKLVKEQGIEVLAIFFETPFFSSKRARQSARTINLPIEVIDITESHLKMVQKPKYGYGENMNPCIDCHALMLRKAGEMMVEEKAKFLITGEVLGQRPMSQNRKALDLVASESGYDGFILRPLSAKCLPITIPEEEGWVERDKLKGFSGRSRKPQMALAKAFDITDYPSPAGGCLLTDQVFSRRLKDLLSCENGFQVRDVEVLKLGRHFRIGPHTKLVVGRNQQENQAIISMASDNDILFSPLSVPGPTVMILGDALPEDMDLAATITASYSDAADNDQVEIRIAARGKNRVLNAQAVDKKAFRRYMI